MRINLLLLLIILSLKSTTMNGQEKIETATFGAGCFWCVEAVFTELKGVSSVLPGYSGGFIKNPAYKEVCNGTTGHAEVAQIEFDPEVITFAELLEVFWMTHDPTTLNQQGADIGTQYRSVIYYHNDKQKEEAEFYLTKMEETKVYPNPIVTEITEFDVFYEAENYHNDYYENNPDQGYCKFVIRPKVEKFRKAFAEKLK